MFKNSVNISLCVYVHTCIYNKFMIVKYRNVIRCSASIANAKTSPPVEYSQELNITKLSERSSKQWSVIH